jgi:hypothetical protein
MPFNSNITPGRPPVLWSEVNDAFIKVNENFDILVATIGSGSGLTPVDFSSLDSDVTPATDNAYDLGNTTHRWGAVFTGEHTTVDPLNGLWAGNAQVKGVGYTINLPSNSTVGGDPLTGIGADLIIDPNKTFFKEIQVNNDLSVVATMFGDTVNFLSGSGVGLAVSSGADSITFSNTGILSVAAGSGITSATVSGVATITNAGVRSLQSTTALPSGRITGAGININSSTGDNLRVTNTGVISISSGVGITVSLDAATGDVTVTNSAPAGNTFAQVEVNGDSANRLVADAASDVLNINSGDGITLTKTVGTDTLTIAVNPAFDLKGSVFGDDSSVIVNAIDRVVTAAGGFIGNVTGNVTGDVKGSLFGDDSTAIINGIDNTVTGTTVTAGAIRLTGGTISTTDSSGITVSAATTFNADVTLENDLTAINQVTIGGNLVVTRIAETATTLNIGRIGTTTTLNGNSVIANGSLTFSGNISAAAWTTSGIRHVSVPATLTDTTSSGTVANAYTNNFGGNTIAASNAVTYTNYGTMFVNTPTAGTNVTITNPYSIITASNILVGSTGTGVITAVAATATTASTAASVGYLGLPQNATGSTTLTIADAGKHIYITLASQTITIPAASSVAYPIGTTITFIAGPSASSTSIAITSDTMYLAGTGTTGTRTLAAYGMATAVKVSGASSSGIWFINGSGLT